MTKLIIGTFNHLFNLLKNNIRAHKDSDIYNCTVGEQVANLCVPENGTDTHCLLSKMSKIICNVKSQWMEDLPFCVSSL